MLFFFMFFPDFIPKIPCSKYSFSNNRVITLRLFAVFAVSGNVYIGINTIIRIFFAVLQIRP